MDKNQLILSIHTERRQLERYLFFFEKDFAGSFHASGKLKFSINELCKPGVIDDWSIKDLLANLSAWERLLQPWIEKPSSNAVIDIPDLEALQDPNSPKNKQIYQTHRNDAVDHVLAEFRNSYLNLIQLVNLVSEDELFKPQLIRQSETTMADIIYLYTASRYGWAKHAIRKKGKINQLTKWTKESLLRDIQQEHQRLDDLINGISPQLLIEPGVIGEWSIKDIMAHLAAWEQLFLDWYRSGLLGETPQIPAPGITWKQLGKLNRMIYEAHSSQGLDEIKQEFATSYRTIVQEITKMSEEMISTPGYFSWTNGYNLQGYIRANTVNHYRWAKNQIHRWLKNR
jgi:hypothetical protein